MKPEAHKIIRQQFKEGEKSLRKLFQEYCDPLPGAPDDEYDCVIDRVLSSLYRGKSDVDIVGVITKEFEVHYGLEVPERDIQKVTEEILAWWTKSRSPNISNAG